MVGRLSTYPLVIGVSARRFEGVFCTVYGHVASAGVNLDFSCIDLDS